MNHILAIIRQRIGPVWSSVIGFFAALGYTTADLSSFVEKISGQIDIDGGNFISATIVAIIGYLVGKPQTETEVVREVDTSPYKPPKPVLDESVLFDDYGPQTPVQEPSVTPLQPTRNFFSDAELDCKCQDLPGCDYRGMDETTMAMINDLREEFGPLIVTSGYRCPEHNRNVGGVDDSYHVKGMAVDLKSPTVKPQTMYNYLNNKYPRKYGIGCYKTFVHVDSRTTAWARKVSAHDVWQQFQLDKPDIALA